MHYTTDNYEWQSSVGHLVAMLRHCLRRNLDQELARCETSSAQWIILMILAHEHGVTAAEMAKRLDYDPGSMTRLLDRLQAKGFIQRAPFEGDRRRICVELTARGRRLLPSLKRASVNVLNRALTGFSPAEHRQLSGYLQRMIDNVR